MVKPVLPCACCGYLTILEEYDICPVCFWEADGVQERDPSFAGGANHVSLIEARAFYLSVGASEPRWTGNVRPPQPHEIPSSN